MNNYEFCAQWVLDQADKGNARVLDYGCGAGKIVLELRKHGVDAFGCDVFYDGGDYSQYIDPELLGGIIKRMEKGRKGYIIPFKDNSFDFVVTNQVMEHVEDIESSLVEIQRVMKPGGAFLSIFPHKGVWREGHTGIPFLQMFPKYSRMRGYYAMACRAIGLGHNKGDKSIRQRCREYCDFIDKWTHYRTIGQIHAAYNKYFSGLQHIEDYWLGKRLGKRKVLVSWLPKNAQKLLINTLCDLVFIVRNP